MGRKGGGWGWVQPDIGRVEDRMENKDIKIKNKSKHKKIHGDSRKRK